MKIINGWLDQAIVCPSPNFNQRPINVEISLLVIHNISLPPGQFGGGFIQALFQNRLDKSLHPYFETVADLQVSSHLLIDRQGEITQFVSFDDRAWHAGQSSYQGIENCNDYSIGIELEGTDDSPYSEDQYQSLAKVTRQLLANYPKLTADRIAGHDQIAPGRKTDPGQAFDWVYYRSLIKESDSL
jgi:N-acetyl-anhydromuramoyl-L-alanine amidase